MFARIALCGVEDTPGKAFSVSVCFAKHGISVDFNHSVNR